VLLLTCPVKSLLTLVQYAAILIIIGSCVGRVKIKVVGFKKEKLNAPLLTSQGSINFCWHNSELNLLVVMKVPERRN